MIYRESIEHDYIRNLKCQSCKQMSSYCRKDSVGLGIRGYDRPWLYSLWGNILSLDFFHVVKPLMPILALLPILSICEKTDWMFYLHVYLIS